MAVDTTMITPAQTDEAPQRCTVCGSHRPLRRVESERWGTFWKCWSCGFEFRSVPRDEFEAAGPPATAPDPIEEPLNLPKRKPRKRSGQTGRPAEQTTPAVAGPQPEFRDAQRSPLRPSAEPTRPSEPVAPPARRMSAQERCPCGCGQLMPEPVRTLEVGHDLEVALTTWLVAQGFTPTDLRWGQGTEAAELRRRAARYLRSHDWSLSSIGELLGRSEPAVSALLRQAPEQVKHSA